MSEQIHFYGQCKLKNNKWVVFSECMHDMVIDLAEMQEMMKIAIIDMRKRLVEYENLEKGFTVLKWIGYEEEIVED